MDRKHFSNKKELDEYFDQFFNNLPVPESNFPIIIQEYLWEEGEVERIGITKDMVYVSSLIKDETNNKYKYEYGLGYNRDKVFDRNYYGYLNFNSGEIDENHVSNYHGAGLANLSQIFSLLMNKTFLGDKYITFKSNENPNNK